MMRDMTLSFSTTVMLRLFPVVLLLPITAVASPLAIQVETLKQQAGYEVSEAFAGQIKTRRSSLLSLSRSGLITEVLVDEGETVEKDQLLARLDVRELAARRRELNAQLDSAKAEVEAQQARLELAERTTKRRSDLVSKKLLSPQQFEEASFDAEAQTARLRSTQAVIAQVQAAIETVDVQLSLSELRAPYAGAIVSRAIDEGMYVSPGQTMLELLETRHLEAHIGLPPEQTKALTPGQTYPLQIGKHEVTAVFRAATSKLDPNTRTLNAIFELPTDATDIDSGTLARLTLTRTVPQTGFWAPLNALTEGRRGLWTVYVVIPEDDGSKVLEQRQVSIIHAETDRAFVQGLLQDNEQIVAAGVHRVVAGQSVKIVE